MKLMRSLYCWCKVVEFTKYHCSDFHLQQNISIKYPRVAVRVGSQENRVRAGEQAQKMVWPLPVTVRSHRSTCKQRWNSAWRQRVKSDTQVTLNIFPAMQICICLLKIEWILAQRMIVVHLIILVFSHYSSCTNNCFYSKWVKRNYKTFNLYIL